MNTLKIKKTRDGASVPRRASAGAAGLDLCACLEAPLLVTPGALVRVPTGIAIELPNADCAALIYARSGLGVKHGVTLSNGVGVIDSDYRGEIQVGLCNLGRKSYTIQPGERIAQLIVTPVLCLPVEEVSELEETERGAGGFGSTGR